MGVFNSVLLIDDDQVSNHIHESLIKELGLTRKIVCKTNGKEALDYIKESYYSNRQLPSLILSDLSMPVMNGIDFIKELKRSELLGFKKIPVAVVSVLNADSEKRKLEEIGNFPFIPKPLDQVKFFQILHSTIVPSLPEAYQKIILQRQKFLEDQKDFLEKQNEYLKESLENIKRRRQELEAKFGKYR